MFQRVQEPSRWFIEGSRVVEKVTIHLIVQIAEKSWENRGNYSRLGTMVENCAMHQNKWCRQVSSICYSSQKQIASRERRSNFSWENMKHFIKTQSGAVGNISSWWWKHVESGKRVSFLILDCNLVEYKKDSNPTQKSRQAGVLLSPQESKHFPSTCALKSGLVLRCCSVCFASQRTVESKWTGDSNSSGKSALVDAYLKDFSDRGYILVQTPSLALDYIIAEQFGLFRADPSSESLKSLLVFRRDLKSARFGLACEELRAL